MSREEVSVLSSARREELRKMQEESEKLRANPLLYLVSPHVKVCYQIISFIEDTDIVKVDDLTNFKLS